jgi:hypothetical protein
MFDHLLQAWDPTVRGKGWRGMAPSMGQARVALVVSSHFQPPGLLPKGPCWVLQGGEWGAGQGHVTAGAALVASPHKPHLNPNSPTLEP